MSQRGLLSGIRRAVETFTQHLYSVRVSINKAHIRTVHRKPGTRIHYVYSESAQRNDDARKSKLTSHIDNQMRSSSIPKDTTTSSKAVCLLEPKQSAKKSRKKKRN